MIVVTGATGNVGRPLVKALAESGEKVVAVSRRVPDAGTLPPGVQHRQADLANPSTLEKALDRALQKAPENAPKKAPENALEKAPEKALEEAPREAPGAVDGVDALFLMVAGDDPHGVLKVAKKRGIRRVVLLSSQGAGTRPESYRHPRSFEDAVRESGLDWTILRPGGFATNTFAWAETIRSHRTVYAPFGDVPLPTIDPFDIAAVAAVVLRSDHAGKTYELTGPHAGKTYELTGPAPISPREQARTIGDALQTPVRFVELSKDDARARMVRFMPPDVVDSTLAILGTPTALEQQVSPDVQRLLGRSPRTFAEWTAMNVEAFR